MTTSIINSPAANQVTATAPFRDRYTTIPRKSDAESVAEVRKHFTQFVGEAFYGQMLKSMRATVGKPAYFHGGRAEEVFQSQLDQQMAQHLTETSADKFADPLFERQFPHLAKVSPQPNLNELVGVRRT
jgi:Rod binding domain-containing protein